MKENKHRNLVVLTCMVAQSAYGGFAGVSRDFNKITLINKKPQKNKKKNKETIVVFMFIATAMEKSFSLRVGCNWIIKLQWS